MKNFLKNKNIVLCVCGGIAAYKSVEFLRLVKKHGANVKVIMTENATHFIGQTTFEALSEQSVCINLFEKGSNESIQHIEWAKNADAVVIAPGTANIIGKLANGIADDALSTFMLAADSQVMVCPSMNTNMFNSKQVQRNLNILQSYGYSVLSPESGELACGTTGSGRLPDPENILDRLIYVLTPKDLTGKRVLVTAGPTREPIDPVRFISNPSSGKMGFAIAKAAEHRGAEVILITGPTNLSDPVNVNVTRVQTAREMADAVFKYMEKSDVIIKSAAVSDYSPGTQAEHKIKKTEDKLTLVLKKNMDILKELGKRKTYQILIGFAAETQDLKTNAIGKLTAKNLDIIAGNLVGKSNSGFGSDTNNVTLFYKDGRVEPIPEMEKEAVAHVLLDRVVALIRQE